MTSDPNTTPNTPRVLIISKGPIGALLGFLLLQGGILVRVVEFVSQAEGGEDGEDNVKIQLNEHTLDLLHLFGGGIAQSIQTSALSFKAGPGPGTEIYETDTRGLRKMLAEIFPAFSGEYHHLDEAVVRSGEGTERAVVGPDAIPSREYDWVIWSHIPKVSEVDQCLGSLFNASSESKARPKPKLLALNQAQERIIEHNASNNFDTQLREALDLSWRFTLVYTGVSPEGLLGGYVFDLVSGEQKDAPRVLLERLGLVPSVGNRREGGDEYPAWSRFTAKHTIFILLPSGDSPLANSPPTISMARLKETLLLLPKDPYVRVIVVRPTRASSSLQQRAKFKWEDLVKAESAGRNCVDESGEVWDLNLPVELSGGPRDGDGELFRALYTGGNQVGQVGGIRMCVVTPDARLVSFEGLDEMKCYLGMVFPWHVLAGVGTAQ